MENRPKTIFCDLDGTLIQHTGDINKQVKIGYTSLLEGTIEKLKEWERKGYRIIITTGRKESMRSETVKQLEYFGIFYDLLIMGIGGGCRVLINDLKEDSEQPTAIAINPKRNEGIKDIEI
jgi:hydroxymethylpyrimidine pyrophosphatase-like HAD family hydrolase